MSRIQFAQYAWKTSWKRKKLCCVRVNTVIISTVSKTGEDEKFMSNV